MDIQLGSKVLITTHNWFIAPDGKQYKAVWGTVKSINDSTQTLGVKTNARSTNWYVQVGNMIIAGCQIFYVIQCDKVYTGKVNEMTYLDSKAEEVSRETSIYIAD